MIFGEHVRLRAFNLADAETVWSWYQDHEFGVLDGNIYGASLETIRTFVQSMGSPSYADVSLGIETEDGALIGLIRLKRGSSEDRHADFGIAIERTYWSRGYGTDATRTILRFAFEEINLSDQLGLLQAGGNVLAIHGLNESSVNSDFFMLAELWDNRKDAEYDRL